MKIKQIDVTESNADELNRLINSDNTIVFAAYMAHWCSHCKRLNSVWDILISYLKKVIIPNQKMTVVLARIEQQKFPLVPSSNGVNGFPTIKVFANGERLDDYAFERSPSAMTNFLKKIVRKYEMTAKKTIRSNKKTMKQKRSRKQVKPKRKTLKSKRKKKRKSKSNNSNSKRKNKKSKKMRKK